MEKQPQGNYRKSKGKSEREDKGKIGRQEIDRGERRVEDVLYIGAQYLDCSSKVWVAMLKIFTRQRVR